MLRDFVHQVYGGWWSAGSNTDLQ